MDPSCDQWWCGRDLTSAAFGHWLAITNPLVPFDHWARTAPFSPPDRRPNAPRARTLPPPHQPFQEAYRHPPDLRDSRSRPHLPRPKPHRVSGSFIEKTGAGRPGSGEVHSSLFRWDNSQVSCRRRASAGRSSSLLDVLWIRHPGSGRTLPQDGAPGDLLEPQLRLGKGPNVRRRSRWCAYTPDQHGTFHGPEALKRMLAVALPSALN